MRKTVELAACQVGLPAEVYYIPVFDSAEISYVDLEKVPASIFYNWLNDVADICGLHLRFIARDDWYESPADRWSAIKTLAWIAHMHGKLDCFNGIIYTRDDILNRMAVHEHAQSIMRSFGEWLQKKYDAQRSSES